MDRETWCTCSMEDRSIINRDDQMFCLNCNQFIRTQHNGLTLPIYFTGPDTKPCWKQLYDLAPDLSMENYLRQAFIGEAVKAGVADDDIHDWDSRVCKGRAYIPVLTQSRIDKSKETGGRSYACRTLQKNVESVLMICDDCGRDPRKHPRSAHSAIEVHWWPGEPAIYEIIFGDGMTMTADSAEIRTSTAYEKWLLDHRSVALHFKKEEWTELLSRWLEIVEEHDTDRVNLAEAIADEVMIKILRQIPNEDRTVLTDDDEFAIHVWRSGPKGGADPCMVASSTIARILRGRMSPPKLRVILEQRGLLEGTTTKVAVGTIRPRVWQFKPELWDHPDYLTFDPVLEATDEVPDWEEETQRELKEYNEEWT